VNAAERQIAAFILAALDEAQPCSWPVLLAGVQSRAGRTSPSAVRKMLRVCVADGLVAREQRSRQRVYRIAAEEP
jgi:DNA-binding MarR family transcriptional regulator